jgi:hypothetical protein
MAVIIFRISFDINTLTVVLQEKPSNKERAHYLQRDVAPKDLQEKKQ